MPRVVALFRHPIKSFTPELVEAITVQPDGRVAGDRVLAFRFADATHPEERDGLDHWPKAKGLASQDFPDLARLQVSYDEAARRVRIDLEGELLVEAGLDSDGRAQLAEAVTQFVRETPDSPRLERPGRLPLTLVGDGVTSRFQDRAEGYVSVHGQASVHALGDALQMSIDARRFRSNVVIDGVGPWDELEWTGDVRIGEVSFRAAGPIVRCLATHANPDTGVRDAKVLTTLTSSFAQQKPTLGRLLLPGWAEGDTHAGGVIRIGDEVQVTSDRNAAPTHLR